MGYDSVLSFHATKVFNTIEGGAICFKEEELYERLYHLKNFGITSEEIVEAIGANGKMHEFSAAMGLCNLKNIKNEIRQREYNTLIYDSELRNLNGIKVRERKDNIIYNYSYYPILCNSSDHRNIVYENLKKKEIYARKYFFPLTSDHKCFGDKYKHLNLETARYVSERILTLPLYSELNEKDIKMICKLINVKERRFN